MGKRKHSQKHKSRDTRLKRITALAMLLSAVAGLIEALVKLIDWLLSSS